MESLQAFFIILLNLINFCILFLQFSIIFIFKNKSKFFVVVWRSLNRLIFRMIIFAFPFIFYLLNPIWYHRLRILLWAFSFTMYFKFSNFYFFCLLSIIFQFLSIQHASILRFTFNLVHFFTCFLVKNLRQLASIKLVLLVYYIDIIYFLI